MFKRIVFSNCLLILTVIFKVVTLVYFGIIWRVEEYFCNLSYFNVIFLRSRFQAFQTREYLNYDCKSSLLDSYFCLAN